MPLKRTISFVAVAIALTACQGGVDEQPEAQAGSSVEEVVATVGANSISFKATLADLAAVIDAEIEAPIIVPIPKDAGGGYTHDRTRDPGALSRDIRARRPVDGRHCRPGNVAAGAAAAAAKRPKEFRMPEKSAAIEMKRM